MKKIIFTLWLGIIAATGYTQSAFSLGVTGGMTHSTISSYENNVFNPRWNAGIRAVYGPGEHWAMEMDLLYSREGYQTDWGRLGLISSRLDYLRFTDKITYFFRPYSANFRPKIAIGPSVGLLVNHSNPNGEVARPVDFGLSGEIGFNYRLINEIWFNVDAGYYQGLVDVYERPSGGYDLNSNMGLNMGLIFGF